MYKHTDTPPPLKLVVVSVSVKARLAILNQPVARRPSVTLLVIILHL